MTPASQRFTILPPAALAVLLFAGCSGDANEPGAQTSQSAQDEAADQMSDWVEFTSPEGGFRTRFPSEPDVQPGEDPNEATIQATVGSTAYAVYYFELPELDPATTTPHMVLDGARDGSIASVEGKQVSHERLTIAGHPAQSYRLEIPAQSAVGEHRILLVGKRLYSLSVIGPEGDFEDSAARKFFEAFALVERS